MLLMNNQFAVFSLSEVIEHVRRLHTRTQDFEDGTLVNRLSRFHRYVLARVPVSALAPNESCLYADRLRENMDRICAQPNTPAIVFDFVDNAIIDGTYRAAALKRLQIPRVDAFIGLTAHLNMSWTPSNELPDDELDVRVHAEDHPEQEAAGSEDQDA